MALLKNFKLRVPPKAKPGEVNYPLFDRFTLVHFLIGMTYGFFKLDFVAMSILAVLWELVENPIKAYLPRLFPHGTKDTLVNSVGDCVAVATGWALVLCFWPR
jgi:hypothetical protein